VPELLARGDGVGTAEDVKVRAETTAVPPSRMSRPAPGAAFRQMSPQLDRLAIRRMGELVDRLVADRHRMTLQSHPSGDLLRRPAVHDPLDNRLANMAEARELAQLGAAFACHVIGRDAIVAVEIRHLRTDKGIAFDLTKNRRAVAAEFFRDDLDTDAGHPPASDPAAFIHVDLGVGAFHALFLA